MTIKPMLAHNYDTKKHKIDGWWLSEKYDGVRGLWDGKELYSRNGNIYTIPSFIRQQLSLLKDDKGKPMKLDGEIWFGLDTFDLASGTARKNVNDDNIWKQMKYMVFDTPISRSTFKERQIMLYNSFNKIEEELPNIELVRYTIHNENEISLEDKLTEIERKKGEGIILRHPESLYTGKRSHDMLKVKTFMYKECKVIGYIEGDGRLSGLVGSLLVELEDKTNFKVGSGLSDIQRYCGEDPTVWDIKNYQSAINNIRKSLKDNSIPIINSVITFRYKELTKAGIPKFPTFVCVRNYE